jgi:hypothetical protein
MAGIKEFGKPDTLISRFSNSWENYLKETLGKDLYGVFERGSVRQDLPFGWQSKLTGKDITFEKRFGKDRDWKFDFSVGTDKEWQAILKKEF